MRRTCESGQATVEAAFLLPVLFVALLPMQPGILCTDRLVMQAAASEGAGCWRPNRCGGRHGRELRGVRPPPLGAIPPVSRFHVHEGAQLGHPVRRRRALGRGARHHRERGPLPLLDGAALCSAS
ncbi:MAG: TadE/TadG family type IV pilus assembly protein [Eggerthella lenta]